MFSFFCLTAFPATVFGAKETNHSKLNDNLGAPDDPATAALAEFVGEIAAEVSYGCCGVATW